MCTVQCDSCGHVATLAEILDRAKSAILPQKWVAYGCPGCRRTLYFRVEGPDLAFGILDGFPGPCFIPNARAAPQDFNAIWGDDCLKIDHKGRSWTIKTG